MNRENFDKYEYWITWRNNAYLYGKTKIEDFISDLVIQKNPRSIFEIAIGNGYPYAEGFAEKGLSVSGCDISPMSVESARKRLEKYDIKSDSIFAGDISTVDFSEEFDCMYCLRSSWYMSDFYSVIMKMKEHTKTGGGFILMFSIKKAVYI